MSLIPHHTDDLVCALCELKLKEANPFLISWFHKRKETHPNMHVSWAYRGREDQEKAFQDGASLLHFPNSAHNHSFVDGKGQEWRDSMALDIFQIKDGKAVFDPIFCARLNDENEKAGIKMIWGGKFKKLGDSGHFQYDPSSSVPPTQ